ncbi:MAG: GTPase HflX [Clostridia bacterium]|nr:GTPase HflX [Clostridia bacterium]
MVTEDKQTVRAVLVGIAESSASLDACERNLSELESLVETAGGVTVAKVTQIKSSFDPRTLIGRGKVAEVAELCRALEATTVVFDMELSPSQIRNLEEDMQTVNVIDRSMLVLDIFALHAVTGEGKLQVELAQLKYTSPRLVGKGIELSRQGGGIGTRGPGESKLETDKRHLKERIRALESALSEMERNRAVMRRQRDRSGLTEVAIVGYTNAGKSTLLNYLTDAGVLSEDKLFATLDPTTRRMTLPSGVDILLTDTVGFIRNLPHHLVEAFKSTLDEVRYADILLVVADATSADVQDQVKVTREVIEDLGAKDTPILYAYNKCDALQGRGYVLSGENTVFISAKTGDGVEDLLQRLDRLVQGSKRLCTLHIPYEKQGIVSQLYGSYTVESVDYLDGEIAVRVLLDTKGLGKYGQYLGEDAGTDE